MDLTTYLHFKESFKHERLSRVIVEVTSMASSKHNIRYINDCEWLEDDYKYYMDECHVYLLTRTREAIPVVARLGMSDIVRMDFFVPDGWCVADTSVGIERSLPRGERED